MLFACTKEETDKLTITSSTQFLGLVEAIASDFQREYGISVSVKGTLGQEKKLLQQGLSDLIITDSNLERNGDINIRTLAKEKIILAANINSPPPHISTVQLLQIYQGQLKNWQPLISEELPIQLLSREPGSSMREIFEKQYLKGSSLRLSLGALTVNSNPEMLSALKNIKGSIGYIRSGSLPVNKKVKRLQIIDSETKKHLPPLENQVYIVWQESSGNVQKFLRYIEHSSFRDILEQEGFILNHDRTDSTSSSS